jgi:anti-sigma-K factor RskA
VGVHDQFAEQAAAYALGALTAAERADFEAHLAVCPLCAAEVRSFAIVTGSLALAVLPATPSPHARTELTTVNAKGAKTAKPIDSLRALRSLRLSSFVAAASVLLAVVLGGYAAQLRSRVSTLESRLHDATLRADAGERQMADLRRTAFEAQSTIAVLAAPDLVRIDLAGQPAAPSASARALWSRSRGLVFTASNLPAPPPGRAYQLWVLTSRPAPISAGMLKLDANGRVAAMIETPLDLPRPVAMAVTLEPEAGVPSPTGDKYLVGLAN